jgi:hypothetical protein
MNGDARPNVGKPVRVYGSSYLGLRAQYPNAFAIQPTPTGYQAVVMIEEGANNVRNRNRP